MIGAFKYNSANSQVLADRFDCILLIQYSVLVCVWIEHSVEYNNTVLYYQHNVVYTPTIPIVATERCYELSEDLASQTPDAAFQKKLLFTPNFSHITIINIWEENSFHTNITLKPSPGLLFLFFSLSPSFSFQTWEWKFYPHIEFLPRTFVTLKNLSPILLTIPPRNLQL